MTAQIGQIIGRRGNTLFLAYLMVLVASCSTNRTSDIGFIAFGDSGYNYNYIAKPPLSKEAFLANEKKSWLEDRRSPSLFRELPKYQVPGTNKLVQASGAVPVAKAMENYCDTESCSFGLMLGDNIYPTGATGTAADAERFRIIFEDTYASLGNGDPEFKLFAAFGNHDWRNSIAGRNAQLQYAKAFDTKVQMYGGGYYSFQKGDAEFFVLDTGLLLSGETILSARLNWDGSEVEHGEIHVSNAPINDDVQKRMQLEWFIDAISSSKAHWKIVYGHHNLWSAGGDKFEQARVLRKMILPTICRYADMYIAGHEHDLEVHTDSCKSFVDENMRPPLPLVISGAASKQRAIHSAFLKAQEKKYVQLDSVWSMGMTWGFVHITLRPDKAVVKMITTPNSGTGIPTVAATFRFERRSHVAQEE